MERSRRRFLKLAGIFALGVGTKPVLGALTQGEAPAPKAVQGENALTARNWGMVIDTRRFVSSEDL